MSSIISQLVHSKSFSTQTTAARITFHLELEFSTVNRKTLRHVFDFLIDDLQKEGVKVDTKYNTEPYANVKNRWQHIPMASL